MAVLSFDLENDFSLCKGNVSGFFYKRLIIVYNLTAKLDSTKNSREFISKVCWVIWPEMQGGRSENDILIALTILNALSYSR